MHTGAHLAQGFWRLAFSSRIYAWARKAGLAIRMLTGAHLAQGFWRRGFCSKIDAWAQKAGSVFENAYWGFSGKGLLSVGVF